MIWLHASKTRLHNILVLSPDTDVYMIGFAPSALNSNLLVR